MRPLRPERCGWCMTGDHSNCVVVVEVGSRPRDGKKPATVGIWRCKCWECFYCSNTKCLSCQRVGVEVDEKTNRCPDPNECRRAKDRSYKIRKREEEKAS